MKATRMKSYHRYKEKRWDNFKEKLDYMKKTVDPVFLLNDLGVDTTHQTVKEIRCSCPVHGGDNRTAFRFNKETRTWVCFTHKCHEVHGNDIIGLIQALTDRDFVGSVDYLKELTGDVSGVDYVEHKRKREMEDFIKSYDRVRVKPESVNEKSLARFKLNRSKYFLSKGFKDSTLDRFDVGGGWKDKHRILRDIIPIRDVDGYLLAYSLRDIRPNAEDEFKYILTPGFDKDRCLYNLNHAHQYGDHLPIIVVEGFKSVWRLHEYGIDNVVCTMGSGITTGQQQLLCIYALKGIVTFFDNDEAGVKGTTQAINDLGDKLDVRPVFIQEVDENGKGLDPADLTKDQVYDYLATYF
jgi:DNA primase